MLLVRCAPLQIHWPVTEPMKPGTQIDPPLIETWKAMEQCVKEVSWLPPYMLAWL